MVLHMGMGMGEAGEKAEASGKIHEARWGSGNFKGGGKRGMLCVEGRGKGRVGYEWFALVYIHTAASPERTHSSVSDSTLR